MKYEYQIKMQQRHLNAIVKALRFRQRFLCGDIYGTIGRAALDAWESLPLIADGDYPARQGERKHIQECVLNTCRRIENMILGNNYQVLSFQESLEGKIVEDLISSVRTKTRHIYFILKLRKGVLSQIASAIDLELKAQVGDLDVVFATLTKIDHSYAIDVQKKGALIKTMAWQLSEGKYGPWFSHTTRFLYDISSAIRREREGLYYETIKPLVANVPLIEISRIW